jgi:hypothetical protein
MPQATLYDFITGAEIPLNHSRLAAEGWQGAYGLGVLLRPDKGARELIREHQRVLAQQAAAWQAG